MVLFLAQTICSERGIAGIALTFGLFWPLPAGVALRQESSAVRCSCRLLPFKRVDEPTGGVCAVSSTAREAAH